MSDTRLNLSAGFASVSVALVLVIAKLWALSATQSLSIAASLADSGLDLMMALGGLAAIYYASRPPDEEHTFGHTSAEDLAALGQSAFILISAGLIAIAAFARLTNPSAVQVTSESQGIAVMVLSIVLTGALVLWQRHVIASTGSKVVAADSLHYLADLIPNVGAILALIASAAFGLTMIDSVVALGAAALLAIGALKIGKRAWDALMDRAAPDDMLDGIAEITDAHEGVRGHHDLKTRMAGSKVFVNLHIELDGEQSLREAHDIGAALRRKILEAYPKADVIIHKDVAGDRD
ncbi:cation diffusion facilitator family transporter [Celeribacter sp.]|uniref:cation diffusion facilitator family transporter n=1 Tax=Celeribacter sp. TaxID=1890673 RepID=UPI003A8CB22C